MTPITLQCVEDLELWWWPCFLNLSRYASVKPEAGLALWSTCSSSEDKRADPTRRSKGGHDLHAWRVARKLLEIEYQADSCRRSGRDLSRSSLKENLSADNLVITVLKDFGTLWSKSDWSLSIVLLPLFQSSHCYRPVASVGNKTTARSLAPKFMALLRFLLCYTAI